MRDQDQDQPARPRAARRGLARPRRGPAAAANYNGMDARSSQPRDSQGDGGAGWARGGGPVGQLIDGAGPVPPS